MAESNTKGGHSIRNDGRAPLGNTPNDTRPGSNSPRVPAGTGPTAASGGKKTSRESS